MTYRGHVANGVVVLDSPTTLPEGTAVRVEPFPRPTDHGCFEGVQGLAFDPAALESMRASLTPEQYEALLAIAGQGGPDLDALTRLRAASLT